jgi:hypothetical protein
MTELAFHGIDTSRKKAKSVTHVSGTICHLCLGPLMKFGDIYRSVKWVTAMKIGPRPERWLRKKAKQGMRGFPVGTVAFYGPDDRRASKVAVSFIRQKGAEPELRRWFSEAGDVRSLAR